jgi:RimJ/RimL family protein N-acetyltransferase
MKGALGEGKTSDSPAIEIDECSSASERLKSENWLLSGCLRYPEQTMSIELAALTARADQFLSPAKAGARPLPPRTSMAGRYCRIEPLDAARHATELYDAYSDDEHAGGWTYLGVDPPTDIEAYRKWLTDISASQDPMFFAVIGERGSAEGLVNYMRVVPDHGVIEIGHVHFSPRLRRTRSGTECIFLMLCRVFEELGYRRCEWNCDSRNTASCFAALRYGFTFEGLFRQAMIVKGQNRDTSWFSIIDSEWPAIRDTIEAWLDPTNFDSTGMQRKRLVEPSP